ncbi:hypothetical protein [Nocardioides zeae]
MPAPSNTFVEGDNLDVLAALDAASVDVAYLDPPYNRDSALLYRDRSAASRAGAADRHATWVAMMRPRLAEVRRVLAPPAPCS